jgi:SCY1-like protein 2
MVCILGVFVILYKLICSPDILPIIHLAIESPTHSIVDASLRSLPVILPVLDFSTIKNELFPVIASVFTKTSSLGIKVRGLEAFAILCGASNDPESSNDGLDGIMNSTANKKSSSTALDKYTMQEKIIPLIKGIKTKEPAVAIAALNVIRQVGGVADAEFVAMDILPVLWSMSLGPLLDLKQFQSFMELIKSLSTRVETEQTRKLQELGGSNGVKATGDDFMSFGVSNAFSTNNGPSDDPEIDFERLVKGNAGVATSNSVDSSWDKITTPAQPAQPSLPKAQTPSFAWSTPSPTTATAPHNSMTTSSLRPQNGPSRTITPDLSRFDALSPTSTQFSQPLQPQTTFSAPMQPQQSNYSSPPLQPQSHSTFNSTPLQPQLHSNYSQTPLQPQTMSSYKVQPSQPSMTWNTPAAMAPNPWASTANQTMASMGNSMSNLSISNQPSTATNNSFSLPPPSNNGFSLPPPPGLNSFGAFTSAPPARSQSAFGTIPSTLPKPTPQKSGLDAWESLL